MKDNGYIYCVSSLEATDQIKIGQMWQRRTLLCKIKSFQKDNAFEKIPKKLYISFSKKKRGGIFLINKIVRVGK